ncbi:MAG: 6-phosphogluconolactonase [Chloroflexota bacterium]|nr:6-phosphogluconolactonase [Chloroflexota bacterium]
MSERPKPDLRVYFNGSALAAAAAERIADIAERAFSQTGRFILGLSGGSTPRLTYEMLTDRRYKKIIDWASVQVFWSDERCVPPGHRDSNYRMARQALLDQVDIPAPHIHRIHGELPAQEAAARYERELREYFEGRTGAKAQFDLLLLGMGADAHTASLFPGTAAIREQKRWAVAQDIAGQEHAQRVTLTPLAINSAKMIMFLVSGADKAEALKHVFDDPYQPDRLPAQIVNPTAGNVVWMVDEPAASIYRPPILPEVDI